MKKNKQKGMMKVDAGKQNKDMYVSVVNILGSLFMECGGKVNNKSLEIFNSKVSTADIQDKDLPVQMAGLNKIFRDELLYFSGHTEKSVVVPLTNIVDFIKLEGWIAYVGVNVIPFIVDNDVFNLNEKKRYSMKSTKQGE